MGPVRVGGPVRASRIRPNTIFGLCVETEGEVKKDEGRTER